MEPTEEVEEAPRGNEDYVEEIESESDEDAEEEMEEDTDGEMGTPARMPAAHTPMVASRGSGIGNRPRLAPSGKSLQP